MTTPRKRNKDPAARHVAYEMPGDRKVHRCKPAPSSKQFDESEDEWLERTRKKFVPANAVKVRFESD